MNWCCESQRPLKKKVLPPVYEKKEPVSSIRALSSSNGIEHNTESPIKLKSMNNTQEGDIRKLRHETSVARGQRLQKVNDFTSVEQEQDPTNRFIMKKIRKCGYDMEQMAKRYRGTKEKWVDPDFEYEELKFGKYKVEWRRPQQFISTPDLFPPEISPNDMIQGWLNNCYFLSAVSCLAERPYRIYSLFETKEYNPNGYYICKFTFNGIYQEVIVDDLFPVINSQMTIYVKPVRSKYIWVMVLEKCWAKLLKNYTNTNYGYTSQAFSALTGAPTKFHLLRAYKTMEDPTGLKLYGRLKECDEKHYVAEVSIGRYDSPQVMKKWVEQYGLPTGHAYSLLGVYQTQLRNGNKVKLLQIRNPWGDKESKLIWNDKDPQWNLVYPSEKIRMQQNLNNNSADGVFYMDWETFVVKFNYMFSICEINDDSNYVYTSMVVGRSQPKYLEMQTDGDPEDLAISFVQEMQLHFKEVVNYANISVVASKIEQGTNKIRRYKFYGAGNYYSNEIENYFTFPIKKFGRGRYIFRVVATWAENSDDSIPLVVGLYSPAVIGLREVSNIDDRQFLELNCLSLAVAGQNREPVVNDPQSWSYADIVPGTNLGYFIFTFGANSAVKDYLITFYQSSSKNVQFMFQYEGKRSFQIDCEKGYQYIVLFGFQMSEAMIFRQTFLQLEQIRHQIPRPEIRSL